MNNERMSVFFTLMLYIYPVRMKNTIITSACDSGM